MVPCSVGFDLVDLGRFCLLYGDASPETLGRIFVSDELADAGDGIDRMARLAARFAAKEATFKALGGLEDGIAYTDVVVRRLPTGAPALHLQGGACMAATRLGINCWLVSLSHADTTAGAVVIGLSAGPRKTSRLASKSASTRPP
jgi:holo-[acyl-carrier protein] synthase